MSGLRCQGWGARVQVLRLLGYRVDGLGLKVLGFRVEGVRGASSFHRCGCVTASKGLANLIPT